MKINENLINAWNSGNPVGAYGYNLFGNQISFTADSIVYTNYTYRPDGLRHSIGDKVHIWDGANIVADIDGSNVIVYIRGINLIYADDGDRTYYHFNAHGDVVVLTNSNGSKTKSYSYNAFGVEYNEATLDDNPFRYCGEYYDKETQTIYLRARYYNAEQGRFTQEDTIRDGYNWYAYCENNPIMFVDPTGYAVALCFGDIPDLLGGNDVLSYGLCGGGGSSNSSGYASEPTIPEFIGEFPIEEKLDSQDLSLQKEQNAISSLLYVVFVNPTVSAYNAIEFEFGVGDGIGVDYNDNGARIYTDTTVMFDNGEWCTGHVAVAEIGSGPVSFSKNYTHYSEKGGKPVRCVGDHAYEKRTYANVSDCYISEKSESRSFLCFTYKNNEDLCTSTGGSLHFIIGGHINIGFNWSEYIEALLSPFN